eukprot:CAMPEP_0168532348 /NCGR_PEP_ID=MMETSP0405-20121227/16167_1 /TAXON_ID=498012 /ORGANISM="Trichosphaerium sp, Strain Am-I-7 wt" /LENGTH=81 /DNA_ID=CAMNT_0008557679 /DNA_START=282 /DNA_END=524 /DNA_ORIENTATION=+
MTEISEEYLPESQPRFMVYLTEYKADDGRISIPLVFVYYCPNQCNPKFASMYASTKTRFVNALSVLKIFDIRDLEQLTTEW